MNKNLVVLLSLAFGIVLSTVFYYFLDIPFRMMSLEAMRKEVVRRRGIAIEKAKAEGVYKCCYQPGCTMCFMEANEWNHQTPGRCDCTPLIAQGKRPCPQCEKGLEGSACVLDQECE